MLAKQASTDAVRDLQFYPHTGPDAWVFAVAFENGQIQVSALASRAHKQYCLVVLVLYSYSTSTSTSTSSIRVRVRALYSYICTKRVHSSGVGPSTQRPRAVRSAGPHQRLGELDRLAPAAAAQARLRRARQGSACLACGALRAARRWRRRRRLAHEDPGAAATHATRLILKSLKSLTLTDTTHLRTTQYALVT